MIKIYNLSKKLKRVATEFFGMTLIGDHNTNYAYAMTISEKDFTMMSLKNQHDSTFHLLKQRLS